MPTDRILVIDNEVDYARTLSNALRRGGLTADEATGPSVLQDALAAVARVTYPVALVDIALAEPSRSNRDGVKILDAIKDLNEGTRAIPLTSQRSTSFAAELISKHGAVRYLDKDEIDERFGAVVNSVREELGRVRWRLYGPIKDATELFERLDEKWVTNALMSMKPNRGYDGLKAFLGMACDPLAPLLPPLAGRAIDVDASTKSAMGRFWSKGLGAAVAIVFCQQQALPDVLRAPPGECEGETLLTPLPHGSGLVRLVFRLKDGRRELFAPVKSERAQP